MILDYELRVLGMRWYLIIHSLAVSFIYLLVYEKHRTDMTQPSYIQRPMTVYGPSYT